MTHFPRRGYVYWALLDKRRPVLVVSADYRNEYANDVLIIPCTTTLRRLPTHVSLGKREAGLRAQSVIKCEQMTNVEKTVIGDMIGGPLSTERMRQVVRGVLLAMDVL